MSVTKGIVNEHLLPMVPVSIRKGIDQWQQANVVLDTGFNGDIVLEVKLLEEYGLSTERDYTLTNQDHLWSISQDRKDTPPIRMELLWAGAQRTVEVTSLPEHPFSGMLGTNLLRYKRVTIDATEGGIVTVDTTPTPSRGLLPRWRSDKPKRRRPLFEAPEEYLKWSSSNLPWTDIQLQDGKGGWQTIWVNIDTGYTGELSLPSEWVAKLGLRLPNQCLLQTVRGLILAECGDVGVKWQGRRRRIDCTHRPDDSPPLIGMKLLEGNRITLDFDFLWPRAELRPLPRPPSSVARFLDSLGNRLRSSPKTG